MKERPILFSGAMVRAILAGEKTQTRRVVKPQPCGSEEEMWSPHSYGPVHLVRDGEFVMRNGEPVEIGWGASNRDGDSAFVCPYGKPGDRLWVRETFTVGEGYIYRAEWEENCPNVSLQGLWNPPIFMPRAASRITLEITVVRVERLKSISEGDAKAEGSLGMYFKVGTARKEEHFATAKEAFEHLWKSINGPTSWDLNPWVWVVEFRRLSPADEVGGAPAVPVSGPENLNA
jgi:hypothetical protein